MLIIAAIVVSMIGWSGNPYFLAVAMLFPALWAMAPTRAGAALVAVPVSFQSSESDVLFK